MPVSKPNMPKIVVLGGGTGSFVMLQGVKQLQASITAVVNMCDDGGSTGVLRDELGVLPPGDVRQCLVALSKWPELRELFNYRFTEGSLKGQSTGNLILSALELQHSSFEKAVEIASKILRIQGRVVPIVTEVCTLVMTDGDETLRGQHVIDTRAIAHADARVMLEPNRAINPKAVSAIMDADIVVIAPGGVYGSLLPLLCVDGMAETLRKTKAPVVMVANLMNDEGQTPGWHVVDYVKKIEEYIGVGRVGKVLYNNVQIPGVLLVRYASEGEFPVSTDAERFGEIKAQAISTKLFSDHISFTKSAADVIKRSYIRHDPDLVAAEIAKLL